MFFRGGEVFLAASSILGLIQGLTPVWFLAPLFASLFAPGALFFIGGAGSFLEGVAVKFSAGQQREV